MTYKRFTNLYLSSELVDYFTNKARKELLDENEAVNKVSLQRRRSRLMVEILTDYYENDEDVDE